MNNNLDMN